MDDMRRSGAKVAIGLGSNLGDRRLNLETGVRLLWRAVEIERLSAVYETDPVGCEAQGAFLNACVAGTTSLTPREVLEELKHAERLAGRSAGGPRFGPRVLDLDLLLYGEATVDLPDLVVPHPRLRERAFVLVPLREIAADWWVPGREDAPRRTVRELAAAVDAGGVAITPLKLEDDE